MPTERPPEPQHDRFPQSVVERIGFYVYVLHDPRDHSVFYIGKGTGNRVFAHVGEALDRPTSSDKLDRIRAIHDAGERVDYEIVRHGMDEDQALAVESALIDWIGISDLTNAVAGHGADRRGRMTIAEIIATYRAEPVSIEVPCLLITVNRLFARNVDDARLYEITRGDWVVGNRREKARFALGVFRGLVRAAYRIERWESVTATGPGQRKSRRWRFSGSIANDLHHLIGGDVTAYLGKASQNPIRYVHC